MAPGTVRRDRARIIVAAATLRAAASSRSRPEVLATRVSVPSEDPPGSTWNVSGMDRAQTGRVPGLPDGAAVVGSSLT